MVCPPPEENVDHIIQHKHASLPNGIVVRVGQKFAYSMWINYNDGHNRCYYSESGDSPLTVANEDQGLFNVEDSDMSSNSTRQGRGIVPGLLY